MLKDDVVAALAADRFDETVETLSKVDLFSYRRLRRGTCYLNEFIKQRQHLLGVVDEYGGLGRQLSASRM